MFGYLKPTFGVLQGENAHPRICSFIIYIHEYKYEQVRLIFRPFKERNIAIVA